MTTSPYRQPVQFLDELTRNVLVEPLLGEIPPLPADQLFGNAGGSFLGNQLVEHPGAGRIRDHIAHSGFVLDVEAPEGRFSLLEDGSDQVSRPVAIGLQLVEICQRDRQALRQFRQQYLTGLG